MSGYLRRFAAWQMRTVRWWWTITAAWELGCVVLIDDPWTKTMAAVFAAWFAFWAGWRWREHVAIRRLERLDGQTGRDLIIATAQRYNRYGFAVEFVPMSDLLRKTGDGR